MGFIARRTAEGRPHGGDTDETVESFNKREYEIRVQSVDHGARGEETVNRQWERHGAQGRDASWDPTGCRLPTACDGDREHGGKARRGRNLDVRPSNHAVGHTAVAAGCESNGAYPVAPLNQRGGGGGAQRI